MSWLPRATSRRWRECPEAVSVEIRNELRRPRHQRGQDIGASTLTEERGDAGDAGAVFHGSMITVPYSPRKALRSKARAQERTP